MNGEYTWKHNGHLFLVDVEVDSQSEESGAPFYNATVAYSWDANGRLIPPIAFTASMQQLTESETGNSEDEAVENVMNRIIKREAERST